MHQKKKITGKNLVKTQHCAVIIWATVKRRSLNNIIIKRSRPVEAWLSARWENPAVKWSAGQYCAELVDAPSASSLQSAVKCQMINVCTEKMSKDPDFKKFIDTSDSPSTF